MSASGELPNDQKPVVKGKNPHNYRKVGYCMIIIAVSLVVIGLLSWGMADDYHFASNIMALQEVDSMTPKSGYNIVLFDISQPVGAKLKMLDHADTLDDAFALQNQDAQQNQGNTIQVLIFNGSKDYNLNLMKDAEVYVQTPKTGYNIVLDSYPLAVGAQLAVASHDGSFDNATADQKVQEDNIQGQEVKVLIFSSNYIDNLKTAEGTNMPVGAYALLANQTSVASNMTQATNQTAPAANATSSNATALTPSMPNQTSVAANKTTMSTNQTSVTTTNKTTTTNATASTMVNSTSTVSANKTATLQTNQTVAITNMTKTANQTTSMPSNRTTTVTTNSAQSNATLPASSANVTSSSTVQSSTTVVISKGASTTQGTCTTIDCFDPQIIDIQVGNTVTWINDDTVGHTATSGKVTDNQTGTVWDSSLIKAGGTYTSPPFITSGTYNYFCQVHPWMTGQVIVGGAAPSQTSTNGTGTTKTVNLNETMVVNSTSK